MMGEGQKEEERITTRLLIALGSAFYRPPQQSPFLKRKSKGSLINMFLS